MELHKINETFIITFKPKEPSLFQNKKRFSIGFWQMAKYIGEENAATMLKKILSFQGPKAGDKYSKKFRTKGEIILYAK
jgi:ribulose bisphosphate carboxylase small subunit